MTPVFAILMVRVSHRLSPYHLFIQQHNSTKARGDEVTSARKHGALAVHSFSQAAKSKICEDQ